MIKLLSHGIMDTFSHLVGYFNRINLNYTSEMRMTAGVDWHNLAAHSNHRKNSQISLTISGLGQTTGTLNHKALLKILWQAHFTFAKHLPNIKHLE